MHWPRLGRALPLALLAAPAALSAQTIDDALMMPHRQLCTGFIYTHDSWDRYWEGSLERSNGNIGTVTTQTVSWMGAYGVTDRLNVIAMVPWVTTHASAGVLSGMHGIQDLSVAVKWNVLNAPLTSVGALQAFAVVSGAGPLTDYTPDFLPLSIGPASRRVSARANLHFQANAGWFVEGTGAYTWRDKVKLDRPYYYTNGQLYFSDEVAMPDVIDYTLRAGYWKHGLYIPISFSQQITTGGGDIRRQDAPFVSNRMNATRVDALVHYYLPSSGRVGLQLGAAYVPSGRNVGQSTTLLGGVTYIFRF
jgi:hypothetical protein